jgi:hypothetical protein
MADTPENPIHTTSSKKDPLPNRDADATLERRAVRAKQREQRRALRGQLRERRYEERARRREERADSPPDLVPLTNFLKRVVDDASEFLADISKRMEERNRKREDALVEDRATSGSQAAQPPKSSAPPKAPGPGAR